MHFIFTDRLHELLTARFHRFSVSFFFSSSFFLPWTATNNSRQLSRQRASDQSINSSISFSSATVSFGFFIRSSHHFARLAAHCSTARQEIFHACRGNCINSECKLIRLTRCHERTAINGDNKSLSFDHKPELWKLQWNFALNNFKANEQKS